MPRQARDSIAATFSSRCNTLPRLIGIRRKHRPPAARPSRTPSRTAGLHRAAGGVTTAVASPLSSHRRWLSAIQPTVPRQPGCLRGGVEQQRENHQPDGNSSTASTTRKSTSREVGVQPVPVHFLVQEAVLHDRPSLQSARCPAATLIVAAVRLTSRA
jgi:hypothetical protein